VYSHGNSGRQRVKRLAPLLCCARLSEPSKCKCPGYASASKYGQKQLNQSRLLRRAALRRLDVDVRRSVRLTGGVCTARYGVESVRFMVVKKYAIIQAERRNFRNTVQSIHDGLNWIRLGSTSRYAVCSTTKWLTANCVLNVREEYWKILIFAK